MENEPILSPIVYRKSILGQFKTLKQLKSYFNLNYSVDFNSVDIPEISTARHIAFIKTLSNDKAEKGSGINIANSIAGWHIGNTCIVTLINTNPGINQNGLLDQFISSTNDLLGVIIHSKLDLNNNYLEIKFLVYDYYLFRLFSVKDKQLDEYVNNFNYQEHYDKVDRLFSQFRHRLFASQNEKKSDLLFILPKVALSYEIVNLETYQFHLMNEIKEDIK